MNCLGIHIGHDSSAALVVDGRIVADVAEERFTRVKHYCGLPFAAIDYCLKSQSLTMSDIDTIAVPTKYSVPSLNFLFDLKGSRRERSSNKRKLLEFAQKLFKQGKNVPPVYIKNFPARDSVEVVHVDHHLAHAASAYYTTDLPDKQLIVTMDGLGDGISAAIWRGENGKIELLETFPTSASLGWFYGNVTEALGWWHGDGEGKTMGLAPYGDPKGIEGVLSPFHPAFTKGRLAKAHDFGRSGSWNENGAIQYHLDEVWRIRDLIEKHGREKIAAEAQRVLEEQVQEIVYPWLEKEGTRNLSCSGGIFLNVKLNQRIWEAGRVEHHHIYPNAGDSGLAVGAALYAYYQNRPTAQRHRVQDLYWGPQYSEAEIEAVLKLRNLPSRRVDNVEKYTAEKLAQDKIVAWFQGRMESGPRALGNRSILMSATRQENKDVINARVKFREAFRPFCPSMLWECRAEYLQKPRDEFFMITSFTCQEGKRSKVPAVVHADATLRPQTLKKEANPRFWNLINEFGAITGERLLLNTSLNIMGEPMISHPREAIRCFYDSGLDYLVVGDFVLEKNGK